MKKFSSTTRVNSRRTSQNKYILHVLIIGAVLLASLWLLPRLIHVATAMVVAPINGVKTWFYESSGSLPQYLRNRTDLVAQINDLNQKLAEGSGDRFTVDMLAKENAELRSLLGDTGEERILAGVIGRPNALPYDMLMIDQGAADGIMAGAPVYIGERTVIGFVQSVTDHTSLVTLITTAGFTSTVYVLGPDIYTNAVGLGGGQLRVGIPQGVIVKEGDLVILPSVTSGVYGSITHIETEASEPEQYAYVAPKNPLGSLRLVAVGKTPMTGSTFDAALKTVEAVRNNLFTVDIPAGYVATSTAHATATPASSTKPAATSSRQ